jgi:hypothetical protein
VPEERALAAFRALQAAELAGRDRLAGAAPERLLQALETAGYPRPERPALLLTRLARSLPEGGDSLSALGSAAEGLDDLGARLVRLAPGLGSATALRFLRPLRHRWWAAREAPLAAPALAAALHLGWIAEGEDARSAPGTLAAALGAEPAAPSLPDLEAALERLGREACGRGRPGRCPLAEACPLR